MESIILRTLRPTAPRSLGGDGYLTISYLTNSTASLRVLATNTTTLQTYSDTLASTLNKTVRLTGLPSGSYNISVALDDPDDEYFATGEFTIPDFVEVRGCTDEYAANYNMLANTDDASCTFGPRWRAAWQPMAVVAPATPGQDDAFITAELRIGFRAGHPLAAQRPLGDALELRATVGPDGYATFRLGPYLQAALGVDDGHGGYRLDLNTQSVDELYVGYELRYLTGEMMEQGYALNAAVPEAQLVDGTVLSSFARVPQWPGYQWKRPKLTSRNLGRYAGIDEVVADFINLPCPPNPIPVAWLNPRGGFDYWVFQGRPTLGDSVGEGQQYRAALTGEQRYSDPGDSYQTYKASSGVFGGDDLLRGLRTLWRSPQGWAQLEPGGEWVPILIPRGDREVGRLGVRRQELVLSFSTATPEWAQGQ